MFDPDKPARPNLMFAGEAKILWLFWPTLN